MMRYADRSRRGLEHCSLARSCLPEDLVRSLMEMNEEILLLLAEQAATYAAYANMMLRQFRELWRPLTRTGRERMAGCPFLLADLGFTDVRRWCGRPAFMADREAPSYAPFFTVPATPAVARQVFNYAWDLARTQESAARLILGMPAHCTVQIRELSARDIHELAEGHPQWLVPRWRQGGRVWRDLLLAAANGDAPALERARSHGYDLIEADSRAAALEARGMLM